MSESESEYTPTTEDVRTCAEGDTAYTCLEEGAFDRWRAKDRAEAQVEALREATVAYPFNLLGVGTTWAEASRFLGDLTARIAREAGIETGEK